MTDRSSAYITKSSLLPATWRKNRPCLSIDTEFARHVASAASSVLSPGSGSALGSAASSAGYAPHVATTDAAWTIDVQQPSSATIHRDPLTRWTGDTTHQPRRRAGTIHPGPAKQPTVVDVGSHPSQSATLVRSNAGDAHCSRSRFYLRHPCDHAGHT